MTSAPSLHALLAGSVARHPDRDAVHEPGAGTVTYRELGALADRMRDSLIGIGVRPGDRVGVYLPKSIDAVAAIFGVLKAGAAYVPVDPGSPPWRAAFILGDCDVSALVVERALWEAARPELGAAGSRARVLVVDQVGAGRGLAGALDRAGAPAVGSGTDRQPGLDSLAYLLYTSGSTGKPKGVMLSHRAALTFVDWCSEVFEPTEEDRFSSHAPFHFDLSILDIYLPLKHGGRLTLIGEELGKEPLTLAPLIAEERLTIWYSTPSILNMLAQYGKLERYDCGALRAVLFAGEVFPVGQLRNLKQKWPHPRYYNLYGPTETNVCTWHPIPEVVPEDRVEPYPIGKTCSHLQSMVVDERGKKVRRGEKGELLIAGPGIMSGYWNLPERNAIAFVVDRAGVRWYHTGDLVVEEPDGTYIFHGRADRMVKRRGYRIELGEIEAGLAAHAGVKEVAVVAIPDPASGVRIRAFLAKRDGADLGVIALKQYCRDQLPQYMTPDLFTFVDALPRTSTDKIDYQKLKSSA